MVVAPSEAMPEIRKRLYEVVQETQREYGCDPTAQGLAEDAERWALTLAFAPVWPAAKKTRRG